MSNIPSELRYAKSHEWVRRNDDGTATVGITDHAQQLLGDLVFVELPEAGNEVAPDESCSVVESVKAASDVYSPVSGEVVEVNEALEDEPEAINTSPYEDGWIMRIKADDLDTQFDELMDAEAYAALCESEDH